MVPSGETAQFWEDLYRSRAQVFSGEPNGVLVTEAEGCRRGRRWTSGAAKGPMRGGWRRAGGR